MEFSLLVRSEEDKIKSWIYFTLKKTDQLKFYPKIGFVFNNRLTTTAGRANFKLKKIELSTVLWQRATEKQKEWLIAHEVCHLVAKKIYRNKYNQKNCHGYMWKKFMIQAGYKPKRFHDINTD